MKWIPEGAVTGHRSKRPNVSGPQSECAGLEAYSAIESTSLCLPTLNSRSCDAGCEATATDRFTADDAEAVTSPPPDRTAIQASNMVSHLCIESKITKNPNRETFPPPYRGTGRRKAQSY